MSVLDSFAIVDLMTNERCTSYYDRAVTAESEYTLDYWWIALARDTTLDLILLPDRFELTIIFTLAVGNGEKSWLPPKLLKDQSLTNVLKLRRTDDSAMAAAHWAHCETFVIRIFYNELESKPNFSYFSISKELKIGVFLRKRSGSIKCLIWTLKFEWW